MIRITTLIAALAFSLGLMACGNSSSSTAAAESRLDSAAMHSEEAVDDLTPAQAEEVVEEFSASTNIPDTLTEPIVFDFSAVWCPPCQRFKPIFHDVARTYRPKARFISVDVDDNQEIARQFGVSSIPQISILKPDGKVVSTMGFMTKAEFTKFLDDNL